MDGPRQSAGQRFSVRFDQPEVPTVSIVAMVNRVTDTSSLSSLGALRRPPDLP